MYRLLIVDDEKMIRMGIKNSIFWEQINIKTVYTAASAKEALELVKQYHPEIIITDISMTEMTGLQFIEQLREKKENCRIIVLTGYDRFDYARQALQLRVQDFLLKPIDEEELKACIFHQVQELEEAYKKQEEIRKKRRTKGFYQQTQLEMYLCDKILGKEIEKEREEAFFIAFPDFIETISRQSETLRIGVLLSDILEVDNGENRFFKLWTMKHICMSMLDEQDMGITFSDGSGRIIIVFFCDKLEGGITEYAEELIQLLENECDGKIRIVLGSEQNRFKDLAISYNDALVTLENETIPLSSIVKMDWEQKRDKMFRETYQEFERALLANINNQKEFLHIYKRFFQSMNSYNISNQYACRCLFEIASVIYFAYIRQTSDSVDERLNALLLSLNGSDRNTASSLTEQFFINLLKKERGDEHELIRKVKQSINENLGGELSVSSLAAEVFITANYLSRIFKRATGEGCNEYIVRKRIEKAKSLLETTTLKTGEIAGMIGYHDINYFSLAFKKQTGMSPTKYREEIRSK